MPDQPISARSLSIGLLLFGMFWIAVALMQDFDLVGGAKAIMLLALAAATVGVTLVLEGLLPLSARASTALVIAIGLVLIVFVVLTSSRLTKVETAAVVALAVMPLALRFVGIRVHGGLGQLIAALTLADAVLVGSRTMIAFGSFHTPDMEDIGTTTIAAVRAVIAGHNPYGTPIDLHPEYPDYPGYKYLPMMMVVYAPLSASSGEAGLRLTNLLLDLGMSATIFWSAIKVRGPIAGMLALAAWLMLPVLPQDIYKHGVTDLAPVLPLVAALAISETRLGRAGLLIGLSVAAKLFPGLLMALCCLRRRHVAYYFIGGIVGILPAVAFYLWGPAEFTRNVFQFILSRPMDETSWMFGAPPIVPMVAKLGYFLFLLGVLVYLVVASPGMVRRCGLIVLSVIGALLTGPDAHNNYMIWWAPFFCILLGSLAASIVAGRDSAAEITA